MTQRAYNCSRCGRHLVTFGQIDVERIEFVIRCRSRGGIPAHDAIVIVERDVVAVVPTERPRIQ